MPRILTVLAGCSLIAGFCTASQVSRAAGTAPPVSGAAAAPTRLAAPLHAPGSFEPVSAKRVFDTR